MYFHPLIEQNQIIIKICSKLKPNKSNLNTKSKIYFSKNSSVNCLLKGKFVQKLSNSVSVTYYFAFEIFTLKD